MPANSDVVRASSSLQDVLAEFASIPPLLQKINQLQEISLGELAYEMTRMQHEPAFELMEQLIADMAIVYSPPKVGGQTITATLWGHPGLPEPKHIHFMSPRGLAFMEGLAERCRTPLTKHRWFESITHSRWVRTLLTARYALRAAGMASIVPKPMVLVGVREPVAQYLSLVFEHWWMYADRFEDLNAESLRAAMLDDPWYHHCNDWFQKELGESLGIDVFAQPFPGERGWEIYENEVARVLVIRQENLESFPQALGALRALQPAAITMENRNLGEAKDYSSHYAAVKKAFRLAGPELDRIYSSPQVRYFYSSAEIASFRNQWCDRAAPLASQKKMEKRPTHVPAAPILATGTRPARHPHHPRSCRPCPKCAHDLQLVPILQQACEERLELLHKLDRQLNSLRPRSILAHWRNALKRVFVGSKAA